MLPASPIPDSGLEIMRESMVRSSPANTNLPILPHSTPSEAGANLRFCGYSVVFLCVTAFRPYALSMENRDRFGRENMDRTFEVARCPNCGFAPTLHSGSATSLDLEDDATFEPRVADCRCPICDGSLHPPRSTSRSSLTPVSGVDLAWEGWLEQRRVERWLWFAFAGGLCVAVMLFLWRF
jgi:hypothetical protein